MMASELSESAFVCVLMLGLKARAAMFAAFYMGDSYSNTGKCSDQQSYLSSP